MANQTKKRLQKQSEFRLGVISALSQQGVSAVSIAEALGMHKNTIYKNLRKLKADNVEPFALSYEIIRNSLPIAALRQAQAVLDDSDTDRADTASYRMLRGGGVYREHVDQQVQQVPDAEIFAGLADLLAAAIEQAAVPAEYSVQTDTQQPPNSSETATQQRQQSPAGDNLPTDSPANSAPTAPKQQRNSGLTLGQMIARTNAERIAARTDAEANQGPTSTDETADPDIVP